MYINFKVIPFEVLILLCCFDGQSASNENMMQSFISYPHETVLNRVKRQGGGGIIPFRPLFVYRQQQKEQQEKWKEIEARKKIKQEQLIEYQQYQQYREAIKPHQALLQSHPTTQYSSYNSPTTQFNSYNSPTTQYSPYNYPTQYSSYNYPSYSLDQNRYQNYYNQPSSSNYYQSDYYDGYEYSYP